MICRPRELSLIAQYLTGLIFDNAEHGSMY